MSYKTGFYWRRNGMAGAFAFERFDSGCFQPPMHQEVCFLPGFGKCRSGGNEMYDYRREMQGRHSWFGNSCLYIVVGKHYNKCR